jgi:hypothetical protein
VVNFFVNFLAAFYGLIGVFSIIPFLLFSYFLTMSPPDSSQFGEQVYLILILGAISSMGTSIIFLVYRYHDLGRKLMILFSMAIFSMLLGLIWRKRIGTIILSTGMTISLELLSLVFLGVTILLFQSKVKRFFTD